MSDEIVRTKLRSQKQLVAVEAPAGCGKTHQGSAYAQDIAVQTGYARVLILAHTHAAVDLFALRTKGCSKNVEIRTLDSFIHGIASAYCVALGLPVNVGLWARTQEDGYQIVANKTAQLLKSSRMIVRALVLRYPILVCDEHQDASQDQHSIIMTLYEGGAILRVFGDPMQAIHADGADEADSLWKSILNISGDPVALDYPHRWARSSIKLGKWILEARATLRSGGQLDLEHAQNAGVRTLLAKNTAKAYGKYQLDRLQSKPIHDTANNANNLLVLTFTNQSVRALNAVFGRRIAIWEGHKRDNLGILIEQVKQHSGDPINLARATVDFLQKVMTGFTLMGFGERFIQCVQSGCAAKLRGKPAHLQSLGQHIIANPDHKGVSRVLKNLLTMRETDKAFKPLHLDLFAEYRDAVKLESFDDPDEGYAELHRRRSYLRPMPPKRAISTIHKAKGLECNSVIIMPCDNVSFNQSKEKRCLLYVAMSRAISELTIVLSQDKPCTLFKS